MRQPNGNLLPIVAKEHATKQEIAAKGKKAAPVVAGYNTAGTRVWEMTREVQFLDELRGKPGVAQIVGLVTQGKADTSRPVAILLERAHCDLSTLLEDIQPHFLPLWLALDVIQQLAATLHMLHTRPEPLDHRNLKPANVLVANKLSQGEISGRADNDDPNDGGPRDALDERLHGGS